MTRVLIGAKQASNEVLGAVIRANPGPEDNLTTGPLDAEVVPTLTAGADFFEQNPGTAEAAARIREIAVRYRNGRPTAQEWHADYRFASRLDADMMKRLMGQ